MQTMNSDFPEQINTSTSGSEVADPTEKATYDVADNTIPTDNGATTNVATEAETAMAPQIDSLKAQLEASSNQYTRLVADFDNYRKRTQKEKDDLDALVKRNTITELLPVVDNFERARAHIKPQNDTEMAIHKSYQGVYKQLVDSLKRLGVSPMRPEGQPFDPNLHEAVLREPTDEHPEGTVLEELVRGYFLGDRVLRHAMVKVAAPKEDTPVLDDNQSSSTDS